MSDVLPVRSDCCGLDEMFLAYVPGEAERARLELGPGWTRRWTATWQVSGGDEVSLVRDLGTVPVAGCEPVRRFSWGRRQRHRPGLQFMVSTGRLHGFESLEEQSLLLALDFTRAEEILPQPFTLRFGIPGGEFREHVPDFLAVSGDGARWLFDVRPARLVSLTTATAATSCRNGASTRKPGTNSPVACRQSQDRSSQSSTTASGRRHPPSSGPMSPRASPDSRPA